MDRSIELAKRLLESKGYKITKSLNFRGLDDSDVISLNEFVNMHNDEYAWTESLEEALENYQFEGDQLKEYEVGDIIMPNVVYNYAGADIDPHKILLIQVKDTGENGIIKYRGFLLSSKVGKSNKYGKYPNNIYIEDYASILYRGKPEHMEAFIRVDDILEFTNEDLATSGVWKGKVSYAFFKFVNNCYLNYKSGRSNKYRYWYINKEVNNGQ